MEDRKQERNAPWLSVPQFGEWDQKEGGGVPDYSLDFSKIRENRKQNKRETSRASIGNEEELINPTASANNVAPTISDHSSDQSNSPSTRRSILSYFNCCVRA